MKSNPGIIALTVGCAMTLAAAPAALAQSANTTPTRSEITNSLRPVPPAMQGGEQGLPTPGTAPLTQPSRSVYTTSTSPEPVQPAARGHRGTAETAPAMAGCAAAAADAGKPSVTLPTITFEFGSAQLKPEAIATLEKLGKSIKKDFPADNTFLIQGHTDAAGSFSYNQELSKERAQAVKDYLVQEMGLKTPLEVAGVGYCQLANPSDPKGAENRRVVVINKAT